MKYLNYDNREKNYDIHFEKCKTEIANTIELEKRRLHKINQKTEKLYRKFNGQKANHREQLCRRLEKLNVKAHSAKSRIFNLRTIYIRGILEQCGIPTNFIDNSRTYIKNDEYHILLGYFAKNIGIQLHGHVIITADGNIRYVRLPGEAHGSLYHIHPPVTPLEFYNKEYVNYERINALQSAGIKIANDESKTESACPGA